LLEQSILWFNLMITWKFWIHKWRYFLCSSIIWRFGIVPNSISINNI